MKATTLLVLALLVAEGAGVVTHCSPVSAQVPRPDVQSTGVPSTGAPGMASDRARARSLLDTAVRTAASVPWSGVQQVTSWQSGSARTTMLSVSHDPASGSAVRDVDDPDGMVLSLPAVGGRLVGLLASRYDLVMARSSWCGRRQADVVEARRPGVIGPSGVAGRFWVDRTTGMVLRREVLDENGRVIRRSALLDLDVNPIPQLPAIVFAVAQQRQALHTSGRRVSTAELAQLGTGAPGELPGGLTLYEVRMHDDHVLQLGYSDGLSAVSVFVQPGGVPALAGGRLETRGGHQVRAVGRGPAQLVWAGAGRTWTLVSDAPASVVDAALAVLPHGRTPPLRDGVPARAWRGLSRVGSWLNPFD